MLVRIWLASALTALVAAVQAQVADLRSYSALRVCADPANAPISSQDGSGFENSIASLLGKKLNLPVQYFWFPQTTGFVRKGLRDSSCDLIVGYAQGDELVQNTNHYYTSVNVLITLTGGNLPEVTTLTEPRLRGRQNGVVAGAPSGDHLARAELMKDVHGYDLFADRRVVDPPGDMLRDLRDGKIEAAILWGPIAGPLAKGDTALTVTPLLQERGNPRLFYRITRGVRPSDQHWKREINSLIRRNKTEINMILLDAGVPLVDDYGKAAE